MTAVRLRYIDIAKGFAIICVVCGHVLIYDFYGFTEAWSKSLLVQFIYSFHMPLFFFLSGLVVSPPSSVKDIPKDIWKRFRTLLMPMFVIGGIYSLAIKHDLSFLADGMKYGYWYFIALFYCYLLNYLTINNLKYRGGICNSSNGIIGNMEDSSACSSIYARIYTEHIKHWSVDFLFSLFPYRISYKAV